MQRHCRRPSIFDAHSNSPSTTGGVGQRKLQKVLIASALFSCCLLAALVWSPAAQAQQSTASITGTVVDPSGAPVKDAKVTAKDVDRGTVLTTQSNDSGAFTFPIVPVGNYEVKAEAKGFQTAEIGRAHVLTPSTALN